MGGPAEEGIQIYPVQIEQNVVQVIAPEPLRNPTVAGGSGLLPPEPTRGRLEQRIDQIEGRLRSLTSARGDQSSCD